MQRWPTLLVLLVSGLAIGQDTPQPPPAEQPEIVDQTSVTAAAATDPQAPPAAAPAPAVPSNDKAIPQAYSEEHYAGTWSRNPFLIEVGHGPDKPMGPGFAEDWELKGLTRDKGQPEALLGNKKTQETRWVKTTEDKDGFKLIKANVDRDMHKSSVEVAKAGEPSPATFTFPEVAAAPGAQGNGARGQPPMPMPQGGIRPNPITGQPNMNNRNGVPTPGVQNNGIPGGVPRMNPGIKTNNGMPAPAMQPTPPGRRRVLIPASPPAS